MLHTQWCATSLVAWLGIGLASCSSAGSGGAAPVVEAGALADASQDAAASAGDPQTPPMGGPNVEAWLAKGYYLQWHCELAGHPARAPSPHGFDRVCSNDLLSGAGSSGPFPQGAASVKEIYDAAGAKVAGHAVYVKLAADSAGGTGWYWYEDDPRFSPAILADGIGGSPGEMGVCVGCHGGAGPGFSPTSRDFVYTQVP
jgi:hypothetical protein